jgi:hypothetical protein
LWFKGGKAYGPWMNLVRISWSKLAKSMDKTIPLSTEDEQKSLARSFLNNLLRASIKHLPVVGSFLYDVIYGTLDEQKAQRKSILHKTSLKNQVPQRKEIPAAGQDKDKWYQNRTIQGALIGAFVLLFVSVVGWIILLHGNKPNVESPESRKVSPKEKLQISLSEICKDIDSRPLVQKEETAKRYVGISIKREPLKLFDIVEEDGTFLLVTVFPDRSDITFLAGWRISFRVKRSEYPELIGAKQGLTVYVSGIIEDAGRLYVSLSEVSLAFN